MNVAVTGPEDGDELPRARTLGARLDAAGRALLERRDISPVWSGALSTLLERVAALSLRRDRFERLESRSPQDPVHLRPGPRGPVHRLGAHRLVPTGGAAARPGGGQGPSSGGDAEPLLGSGTEPRSGSSPLTPSPTSPTGAAAAGPGRPLPADLRARLRRATGLDAEQLRVHTDGPADALARRHAADAVTVDRAVFFRDGRYRPDEPEGFGLLAHEASHVRSGPAGADPRRAEDLERTARRHELAGRAAAATAAQAPAHLASAARPAAPSALPHLDRVGERAARLPVPAAQPAAAPADRDLAGAAPPPFDVEALRRSLLDELKRQLRTESERGA